MAINPETQYPGKIAPGTSDYPYGSARNITVPGDGTGTPWEAALVNDIFGFQQAILSGAGEVPTGTPEKATASQYLTALRRVIDGKLYATVAELQAAKMPDETLVVVAERGYGRFIIKASGYSAEPGDITLSSGKVAAMVLDGPVSVKWFGAVGDGVTDDTAAIQSALNRPGNNPKWATGGIAVFFPQGSYRVTAPLQIDKFSTAIVGPSSPRFSGIAEIFIDDAGATTLFEVATSDFVAAQIKLIGPARAAGKYVVQDTLTSGVADKDYRFYDVVFEAGDRAILMYGRGLQLIDCQYQLLNGILEIDFPNPFTPGGNPDQTLESGFRAIFIQGGRVHACTGYVLNNVGYNQENLSGVQIEGLYSDTNIGMIRGSVANCNVTGCNFQYEVSIAFFLNDVDGLSVVGNSFSGVRGETSTTTRHSADIENFLFLQTGFTQKNITVRGNLISNVYKHVFALLGTDENIDIMGNQIVDCLRANNDAGLSDTYAVVLWGGVSKGLKFKHNYITSGAYTRNSNVLEITGNAADKTDWDINDNNFDIADFPDGLATQSVIHSKKWVDNARLYVGDGTASQVFTFDFQVTSVTVYSRSGVSAGSTAFNIAGTTLGDVVVNANTVEVKGNFNLSGDNYSLMVE